MHASRANADSLRHTQALVPQEGHDIGERYRLDHEAGRTEAGVVFEATDRVARRPVAIEVASSVQDLNARAKWSRDAMMAQRLEGEHILHVLDVGTLPNGMPYLVREVAVSTLADEVATRGALPVQEAVGRTLEACEAVAEAHALGMAHGDLRLENVHLARGANGMVVKVAWTSAAKALSSAQVGASKEDVARDIAGLGALLRVLATGQFDEDAEGARTLPTDVSHAIARAFADEPDGFHNVVELARTLAPFAPPGHSSARTIAFILSRAGIVSSTIPLKERSSLTAAPSRLAQTVAPPDRSNFSEEWFRRGARTSFVGKPLPPPSGGPLRARGMAFALVALALVGFVLGGSWFLWQNGQLPRWTGAAPPEVGTAQVTSAPAEPAVVQPNAEEREAPKAGSEVPSTSVNLLPDAPPVTAAPSAPAPAPAAIVTKGTSAKAIDSAIKPKGELR